MNTCRASMRRATLRARPAVACPSCSRQPVRRVVSQFGGLVLVGKGECCQYRAEHLLLAMARSAGTRSSSIDGKKKPFTEAFDARPERDDRHPVALRRLDHRRDPIELSAVDQRSAIRPVDAGTGAQGLEALFQQIHHLSVNRALGQHPAAGRTSLSPPAARRRGRRRQTGFAAICRRVQAAPARGLWRLPAPRPSDQRSAPGSSMMWPVTPCGTRIARTVLPWA